jgi:hypothetical protein
MRLRLKYRWTDLRRNRQCAEWRYLDDAGPTHPIRELEVMTAGVVDSEANAGSCRRPPQVDLAVSLSSAWKCGHLHQSHGMPLVAG